MDALTAYDLVALILLVVFFVLDQRAPRFLLAFAGVCLAWSIYGFVRFAWIIGALQLMGAAVAFRRWYDRRDRGTGLPAAVAFRRWFDRRDRGLAQPTTTN
jgi:hypothetical protein